MIFLLILAIIPSWVLADPSCLEMYRYQDEGEVPQKTCEEIPEHVYAALGLPAEGRVLLCQGADFNNCESESEEGLFSKKEPLEEGKNLDFLRPELAQKIEKLTQSVDSLKTPQGLKMLDHLLMFVSKRWPVLLGSLAMSYLLVQYANFKYDLSTDNARWPLVLKLVGYLIPVGVVGYYAR